MADLTHHFQRWTETDGCHTTSIPALTLNRWSGLSDPVMDVAQPAVCLIAQGVKEVTLGTRLYRYSSEKLLLVSADVLVTSCVVQASERVPYLGLSLALDPATVCELAAQTEEPETSEPPSALAVTQTDPPLLDAFDRLLGLLASPHECKILAPLVMREITYRLLMGEQGPRLRQMFVGDGASQRTLRALRHLREHYAESIRIEDLARAVHLSPSALHQHFKSLTSLSPLQYQKLLRLHEARRLMLTESLDASEASFRVGYESPSQFSREYRRHFGAPPRKDIDDARRRTLAASARVASIATN